MVNSLAKSEVTGEIQLKRVINALQFFFLNKCFLVYAFAIYKRFGYEILSQSMSCTVPSPVASAE